MANNDNNQARIEHVESQSIVSLKVANGSIDRASERLQLAAPRRANLVEPRSLWIAPNHWLLVSDQTPAEIIIEQCGVALCDILHHVVDQTDSLTTMRLEGKGARELLAAGTGLDLRPRQFPQGSCCRTRLAQIAAVIVAQHEDILEIHVDRSYRHYLGQWLNDSKPIK